MVCLNRWKMEEKKKKKEKRCLQGGRCKQSMTGMFHSLNEGFPVSYIIVNLQGGSLPVWKIPIRSKKEKYFT